MAASGLTKTQIIEKFDALSGSGTIRALSDDYNIIVVPHPTEPENREILVAVQPEGGEGAPLWLQLAHETTPGIDEADGTVKDLITA